MAWLITALDNKPTSNTDLNTPLLQSIPILNSWITIDELGDTRDIKFCIQTIQIYCWGVHTPLSTYAVIF